MNSTLYIITADHKQPTSIVVFWFTMAVIIKISAIVLNTIDAVLLYVFFMILMFS